MGNDAICLEKQGECGAMADAMPVASVEGGDSLIDGLNDKLDVLEFKVKLLEGKFEMWQKLVEPMLSTAQIAIEHDSNLIAVVAIATGIFSVIVAVIVAIAIAVINHFANKDKKEAMNQAIKEINKESEDVRLTGRTNEDSEGDGKAIDKTKEKQLDSKNLIKGKK